MLIKENERNKKKDEEDREAEIINGENSRLYPVLEASRIDVFVKPRFDTEGTLFLDLFSL